VSGCGKRCFFLGFWYSNGLERGFFFASRLHGLLNLHKTMMFPLDLQWQRLCHPGTTRFMYERIMRTTKQPMNGIIFLLIAIKIQGSFVGFEKVVKKTKNSKIVLKTEKYWFFFGRVSNFLIFLNFWISKNT
jgi:hypothetical protein